MSARTKRAFKMRLKRGTGDSHLELYNTNLPDKTIMPRRGAPIRVRQCALVNTSKTYKPNGQHERERRIWQINRGQIKAANGLVTGENL